MRPMGRSAYSDSHGKPGMSARSNSTLSNGFVSYWSLDEAAGTRFGQGSNTTNLDVLTGAVGTAAGKHNNATTFPGSNISLNSSGNLPTNLGQTGNGVTWAAWLKKAGAHTSLSCWGATTVAVNPAWQFRINGTSGNPNIFVRNGAGAVLSINVGSGSITDGAWHLVVITFNPGGDLKLHYDEPGTAFSFASGAGVNGNLLNQAGGVYLGVAPGTAYWWGGTSTGNIDEFMIWDRALTADERTELWNGGAGIFFPF